MSRLDEPLIWRNPDDDIICKTCKHKLSDFPLPSGNVLKRYKYGKCAKYEDTNRSNGKPHDILWKHADCKFYEEQEE